MEGGREGGWEEEREREREGGRKGGWGKGRREGGRERRSEVRLDNHNMKKKLISGDSESLTWSAAASQAGWGPAQGLH